MPQNTKLDCFASPIRSRWAFLSFLRIIAGFRWALLGSPPALLVSSKIIVDSLLLALSFYLCLRWRKSPRRPVLASAKPIGCTYSSCTFQGFSFTQTPTLLSMAAHSIAAAGAYDQAWLRLHRPSGSLSELGLTFQRPRRLALVTLDIQTWPWGHSEWYAVPRSEEPHHQNSGRRYSSPPFRQHQHPSYVSSGRTS